MDLLSGKSIKALNTFRKILHENAELAFNEEKTANILNQFISNYYPNEIISNVGSTGLLFVYNGNEAGPTVLVRADMDALPINETNNFSYKSLNKNVSHKCGHDGHMAIVAGLAMLFNVNRSFKGKVVLMFQPAEETGEGALKILSDKKFESVKPDYVLALHNLPGFKKGEIIYKENHFAAASTGFIVRLFGKTSHAAEPENGNSPSEAMVEIISTLNQLIEKNRDVLVDFSLITVVHARLGERAFGTTPGYAEVMATLRSFRNDDMAKLKDLSKKISIRIAKKYGLEIKIEWTEEFPATVNEKVCVDLLREVISENKLNNKGIAEPFKWSEDFGHFTNNFKGILFGLGAGKNTPQLHNPDYDFPNEIIKTGVMVFYSLIKKLQSIS
ncbi:MAG: amidohydrolase [Bacteroidetes bacterium]|nr:amidohydrolase [Bacteroidota bacterium]